MSYDLNKTIRYGQKIGAEHALILNGDLRSYYKKGSAASKHCALVYTNHNQGRPLRWESANEYSYERIAEFYNNSLGMTAELIPIPAKQEQKEDE